MPRWIGVDYGARRIGIAVSDAGGRIASPATTLDGAGAPPDDAQRVLRWAAEQEAAGIVVGLPLNMDGSRGPQAERSVEFAAHLRKPGQYQVELWDERLSSFQADEIMDQAAVRGSRRKKLRDTIAAQVILQSFLNARHAAG